MALIKCPNCNHDISDTINKCIHCGAKIDKVEVTKKQSDNSIKEKQSQFHKPVTNISKSKTKSDVLDIFKKKYLIRVIINFILTFIFIILIYYVGTVITKHSGTYTLIDFLKWTLDNYISKSFVEILDIAILGYLFIFLLLSCMKGISGKIIKAGYSIILAIELIFIIFMYLVGYKLNIVGVLVPFYTIFWLLIECRFLKKDLPDSKKISNNLENSKLDYENSTNNSIEDLQKLKDLLNNNAITEEEYNNLKETIINNIIIKK